MSDKRVWLRHPETGGHFHCPANAVEDWLDMGWQHSDPPPPEPSPVVAEHLAWRAEQVAAALAVEKQPETKSARRGEKTGE